MIAVENRIVLDQWISIIWDEFVTIADVPQSEKLKSYYYNGRMRQELMSTGSDHSTDHGILISLIFLFATLRAIPLRCKDGCSYRKTGITEFQPDVSYYVGDRFDLVPRGVRVIDLDLYPLPDLVIEVSDTSLADDKSQKMALYQVLGIAEYWILDVQNSKLLAFAIDAGGEIREICESVIIPGFKFDLIDQALQMNLTQDQSAIGSWFMSQWI